MTVERVLAESTVSDLTAAEPWYTALFGRAPDARPMPGLIEWHLVDGGGVQVWQDPDRAGRSGMTLAESDLDALAERLRAAGVHQPEIEAVTVGRIVALTDPDGNRVVFTGA